METFGVGMHFLEENFVRKSTQRTSARALFKSAGSLSNREASGGAPSSISASQASSVVRAMRASVCA